jgi:hypothetical protein
MRAAALFLSLCAAACSKPTASLAVDDAAQRYPDLRTLWTSSVSRTCGPNSGVCHDNRQFPDMQTAGSFLATVNVRCNQLRDDPSVDNLCEPAGDRFQLGSFSSAIGTVLATPSPSAPTSLTLTLHDPLPPDVSGSPAISRTRPGLDAVTLPIPANALGPLSPGATSVSLSWVAISTITGVGGIAPTAALAPSKGTLGAFLLPPVHVPGSPNEVQLADPNGDGIFGADLGGALIKPGQPLESYLFLRVLAPLAVGAGQRLTNVALPSGFEAQMPINNAQNWDGQNDVVALWCWISGMAPDGSNADGPIDYEHCDLSSMPAPMRLDEEASTFGALYTQILQPVCSGCHQRGTSEPTTFYLDDPQASYDTLVGLRGSGPSETAAMPYVTPNDPAHSYLYLKVSGDPSIAGSPMPLGGALDAAQLDAIRTWIAQGANDN